MPEIWLNYGSADSVLDIRAENLGDTVSAGGEAMAPEALGERLGALGEAPREVVMLNATAATGAAVGALRALCESRSAPPPRVLAERGEMGRARAVVPGETEVAELEAGRDPRGMAFLAEAEVDGLFGTCTVAARLLRRAGGEEMRAAYAARDGDSPLPGPGTPPLEVARAHASSLGATAIEVVGGGRGVAEVAVGDPAETARVALSAGRALECASANRSVILCPGNAHSGATLSRALHSLWACARAVPEGGLAVLLAECSGGLGSEALRRFVEGRMTVERTRRPPAYMDGMEDLLYLAGARERVAVAIVSTLPGLYARRLWMSPLDSAKLALEHVLKKGPRQKVAVVADGAHAVLGAARPLGAKEAKDGV
ncbi:MAG: transcriptional regulator [Thaumarchaeota archaeon]|nr:transcriptional regulator [Nitrososphaerota archaeon]MDD9843135.1 transcriptional regulator [Nitrososphaerota archaeon]RNJ72132.1 MAG: transcriptional regulator [Thaumarchaeota archaeon S13]